MSPSRPAQEPPPNVAKPASDDYEAILAAVMETARGRWFIAEFGRRNRHAETDKVLEALRRIERRMAGEPAHAGGPLPDVADLAAIFGLPERDGEPSAGLTGELVAEIAREIGHGADATRDQVLSARGALRGLTDAGADARLCAALDRAMVAIDDLARSQGTTGRKVEQLATVISSIRERVAMMAPAVAPAAARGRPPASGPLEAPAASHADVAPAQTPPPAVSASSEEKTRDDEDIFADATPSVGEEPAAPFTDGLPLAPVGPGARLRLAIADEEQALRELGEGKTARSADAPRTLAELDRLSYEQRYALFAS